MGKFITSAGLKQLDNYVYKGGQWSWLDLKINPWWEFLTTLLPKVFIQQFKTIAPNLVTFIGWIFVILSYVSMLIYDYTFKKEIPSWTFFFAAFCIFVYINMDAIDGKQARRTGASSPLGQLFDHGCDSFSLTFFILAACQATQLQKGQVFFIFIAGQIAFWTSNWMEYHTGVLKTSVGNFGVTETELLCMTIHILTGVFGQSMWDINLDYLIPSSFTSSLYSALPWMKSILSLRFKLTVAYSLSLILISLSIYNFVQIVSKSQTKKFQIALEWFSMILLIVIQYIWFNLSIYQKYNGLILVNFGILSSFILCKLIVSSVTKMKPQYYHKQLTLFLISTALLIKLHNLQDEWNMKVVFWGCFGFNVILTLGFLSGIVRQITSYLGIQCFSINKVPRKMN